LTLVFLGPADPSHVARITTAIEDAAASRAAIDVTTGEPGGRAVGQRGGVAWLSIDRGSRELTGVALDLDRDLDSATFSGSRRPRPHLTVARRVDETVLRALRDWSRTTPPVGWKSTRLVLLRSHTDPGGSRYEELASANLAS